MIPKTVQQFSEKDHAQTKSWSGMTTQGKVITL
jgi:hypothetical protein